MPSPDEVAAALARNQRALRTERGLRLDALAERAGVSRGMLLQIEQQKGNPSLATLVRVADALDVSVNALIDLGVEDPVRVVRAEDAVDLWRGEHGGTGRLLVGSDRLDHLEAWTWVWSIEPGERHTAEADPAGTREMLYVIEGRLALGVGGDRFAVETGDAAVFAADRNHEYANDDRDRTLRFLMVVATPLLARRAGVCRPSRVWRAPLLPSRSRSAAILSSCSGTDDPDGSRSRITRSIRELWSA